jgi:hypothetical protein
VPHERPVIRTQSRRKKKTTDVSCLASPIVVPLVGREEWVGNHGVLGTLPEDGIQEDGNEKKKTDTCSCALLCSNQCVTSTDVETGEEGTLPLQKRTTGLPFLFFKIQRKASFALLEWTVLMTLELHPT